MLKERRLLSYAGMPSRHSFGGFQRFRDSILSAAHIGEPNPSSSWANIRSDDCRGSSTLLIVKLRTSPSDDLVHGLDQIRRRRLSPYEARKQLPRKPESRFVPISIPLHIHQFKAEHAGQTENLRLAAPFASWVFPVAPLSSPWKPQAAEDVS